MKRSHKDNIALCAWNMRGFDIALPYLRKLIDNFQIVCVSEHWLYKNQYCRFENISDDIEFICHSSNRSPADMYGCGRGQGGVGILWNKNLGGVTPIRDFDHDRFCKICLQNPQGATVNIFSVYLPSPGSDDDLGTTLDKLSTVLESREPESLNVICGDCNGDMGNIPNGRGCKPPTKA